MEQIERLLEGLESLCGHRIIWKAVGTGKTPCGVSAAHTYHGCPFCRAVKAEPGRERFCSVNDDTLLPRRAEEARAPFVHRCHAGVSELAVPLFDGGRCTEVFLAGPFRAPGAVPAYPCAEREFSALPEAGETELEAVRRVLGELAPILRARRDALRREEGPAGIRDARIAGAVGHIARNYASAIRVKELAAKACLSESRFLHLFRKEAGIPVTACVTRFRLKAARLLLEESGVSIGEVMEKCGFRDQSRFGKLFREFTGYSPLAYHKRFARRRDV
ncbi:MAG: helix-turn-helix domain-containing protein [Lentisphaeria bacterium]|nr:helix-turn-helix domain-containing protein [Lentisphaeria bacterium]